ncbi:MAG: double-strand break repair helicase AddA, partial [Alphaproteobacteria bacterium]|nr:double-strand break repair helicase AddA [Alphaproteobacteria bacterium]
MIGRPSASAPLTGAQREASDPRASAWVEASAGTGKTQVLTARVLRLLLGGTAPSRILCLTFTKAAAAEMATRLARRLGDWTVAEDDVLADEIAELTGAVPDGLLLGRARRLFARVLDAPGGMRIMTIHAFCQSVLRRFPLEAGVAPHFTVLDEAMADELMAEARDAVLRAEASMPALGDPLARIAAWVDEDGFAELMGGLAKERGRLGRALEAHGGIEGLAAAIRARHGVAGVKDEAELLAAACAEGAFDRAALEAAAQALLAGGKSDTKCGRAIADFLAATGAERVALIDSHVGAFLTEKWTIRARLATVAVEKNRPGTTAALAVEAERLHALCRRRQALAVAEASEAIARLGAVMLAEYERLKRAAAALDYDDLVHRTNVLLAGTGPAWVLFKLDEGLDHILIDEAQDTNPEQWQVVAALAEEFFAGEQEVARTVFAVGDPKQSIFSFQRADPRAFDDMRRHFAARVRRARGEWRDVALDVSFRSTAPVLALVDAVFNEAPAGDGVVLPGHRLRHGVERRGEAGLAELWPAAVPLADEEVPAWAPPTTRAGLDQPRTRLAGTIAQRIADWIRDRKPLEPRGRPIRPGDIMVLVRRRNAFVDELVRALKERGIAVAGVDRMVLTGQIAVMDLMALGDTLLLPEDDLTLATVLKSPLIGLDEDALFRLAHGRAGTLFAALNARAASDPDGAEAAAAASLGGWLARADFVTPYRLFAEVLGADQGRLRLLRRLGHDAADPIDEFLAAALKYEREHAPSLQGFLAWMRAGAAEIKRDLDQTGRDEVRIMTVHGAKGLQAPIVILPDTMQTPSRLPTMLWAEDDAPVWTPRAAMADEVAGAIRDAARTAQEHEYRRLLYVALTRAEDGVCVTGWQGKREPPGGNWYDLVRAGAERIAIPAIDLPGTRAEGWDGAGLRLESAQSVPPRPRRPDEAAAAAGAALPGWA